MPSSTLTRSPRPLAATLVGIATFAVGLAAALWNMPSPGVHAQDACSQPSSDGCPMDISSAVQASLSDATSIHNWLLNIAADNDFLVKLSNLPANYEISIYGPDQALLGVVNEGGTQDKVMQVTNVGTGVYWIVIDSPAGEASDSPYTLSATLVAAAPFSSYGSTPASSSFGSY